MISNRNFDFYNPIKKIEERKYMPNQKYLNNQYQNKQLNLPPINYHQHYNNNVLENNNQLNNGLNIKNDDIAKNFYNNNFLNLYKNYNKQKNITKNENGLFKNKNKLTNLIENHPKFSNDFYKDLKDLYESNKQLEKKNKKHLIEMHNLYKKIREDLNKYN